MRSRHRASDVLLLLVGWLGLATSARALPPDISANGVAIEAATTAAFVLPGQAVTITFVPRTLDETLTLTSDDGSIVSMGDSAGTGKWLFQPGTELAELTLRTARHRTLLRVFRLTPFDASTQTRLRGHPIGHYPAPSGPGNRPPRGLLTVNTALLEEPVSTHFTLGQFVTGAASTDDGGERTQVLLLSTALLETLEHLLQTLRQQRWQGKTLKILSGYRTPLHNAAVGGAAYSRHIYGDGVDLIADADGDGAMDDLNGDGNGDREDVEWLIAQFMRRAIPATMGGAGSYETGGPAGAFLHLDTRGTPADWQR